MLFSRSSCLLFLFLKEASSCTRTLPVCLSCTPSIWMEILPGASSFFFLFLLGEKDIAVSSSSASLYSLFSQFFRNSTLLMTSKLLPNSVLLFMSTSSLLCTMASFSCLSVAVLCLPALVMLLPVLVEGGGVMLPLEEG